MFTHLRFCSRRLSQGPQRDGGRGRCGPAPGREEEPPPRQGRPFLRTARPRRGKGAGSGTGTGWAGRAGGGGGSGWSVRAWPEGPEGGCKWRHSRALCAAGRTGCVQRGAPGLVAAPEPPAMALRRCWEGAPRPLPRGAGGRQR